MAIRSDSTDGATNHPTNGGGRQWVSSLLLLVGLLCAGCRSSGTNAAPSLTFSQIPPAAEGGAEKVATIAGRVSNARSGQQILLYARGGALWWVQPLVAQPFTAIQSDGTWQSSTHLGTEYAALLVNAGYRPPNTIETLPAVGGDIAAVAITQGAPSAPAKILQFSGYEWKLRSAASERGGTLNRYDPANAWTDERGWLHLRIAQQAGQRTCAELQLTRSLGYGAYQFTVRESAHLEPAAVLSMFTWDDLGAEQNHRELGIELTRWGDPASKNTQFAVQPYYVPANVLRFDAPAGPLTHVFRWEPGRAAFKTQRGARVIAEHVFKSGIPTPGGETLHLNLYVFGSGKNALQRPTEVVIEKFEYLP